MSDDFPSSSSAQPETHSSTAGPSSSSHDATAQPNEDVAGSSSRSRAGSLINGRRRKRRNRKKRNPGLAKKLELVTHLLKTLDTLVFAELSALYYMECSMFRFALRAAAQSLYLTPKDESLPVAIPSTRAHVILVVLPNFICILLHMFGSLSVGTEEHRGYLHGGMVIDFVGQTPYMSRLYYIFIDVMLLFLQSLMMTIHNERESLRVTLKTFRPLPSARVADGASARSLEDIDTEEQGMPREESLSLRMDDGNDIELRELNGDGTSIMENERVDDCEPPPSESTGEGQSYLADVLNSGTGSLGDYHILNTMRTSSMHLETATAGTLRTIGYEATAVALEARRRRNAMNQQVGGMDR